MKEQIALRQGRMIQLDVLRGIAILLVLWFHPVVEPNRAGVLWVVGRLGTRIGYSGVDLFFVLSGFLIGGLLFKELKEYGKLNVPRFWIRRGLKIWPGYYGLMLLAFAQLVRHQGAHAAVTAIWPSLVALQNYLRSVRGHTWSLAVEEHFYLLLPLLLSLLPQRNRDGRETIPAVPLLWILVAVMGLGLRLALVWRHPHMTSLRTDPTQLNIDGMFFGVWLAYLYRFNRAQFDRLGRFPGVGLIGLLLLLPMFVADPKTALVAGVGHTSIYLGYGLLLVKLVQTTPGKGVLGRMLTTPAARGLAFVGFYSYSIYLWFFDLVFTPMYYAIEHHGGRVPGPILWVGGMATYVVCAVLVGVVMAKLIELPMLTLRNRWFPARATILGETPAPAAVGQA